MKKYLLVLSALAAMSATSTAFAGVVVNAAEVGIGKFHRMDNKVHKYEADNAWRVFIVGDDVTAQTPTPIVVDNDDKSVTVFYSNLEELLGALVNLAKERNTQISVLNVNAHGMPGGMWFPKDAAQRDSYDCEDWRQAATAEDKVNYDQYYEPIPKYEIMQIRQISNAAGGGFPCVAGLHEWQEVAGRVQGLKQALTADFQVHFLSCVVGLGTRGDAFTKGIAELLLSDQQGRVESSLQYGLGDWSMPEGMGFWDYQNDAQLDHDNEVYPQERRDRTEMQKGTIRVAQLGSGVRSVSGLIQSVDFMFLTKDTRPVASVQEEQLKSAFPAEVLEQLSVRIPGTNARVQLRY